MRFSVYPCPSRGEAPVRQLSIGGLDWWLEPLQRVNGVHHPTSTPSDSVGLKEDISFQQQGHAWPHYEFILEVTPEVVGQVGQRETSESIC